MAILFAPVSFYEKANISINIGAVLFKLGTRKIHHKRNKVTPTMLLPWQYFWLQSLSVNRKLFSKKTWRRKHIRNVKKCANGSNNAKHAWSFGHRIDFDNSFVIDRGSFGIKKTLQHFLASERFYCNFDYVSSWLRFNL